MDGSAVAGKAQRRRVAGGGKHPTHCHRGIQHPAAKLLIPVLNGTGKGLKLRRLAGPASVQVEMFFLAGL